MIVKQTEAEAVGFVSGEIEVDESYFGGHRKGKRDRGAAGKVPVLAYSRVVARFSLRS